ncbi:MAG: 3-hydroxyisobutyrate dehydrogenase [Segniliparus sp.]|uniref:3-hydroxyisobutyrate dehydrogenase n=1 Tax=Segniliparus sp. TaxID=2804064 RepID=UPI003F40DF67
MSAIAFIGLGHMGLPMAANLVKAGHAVAAFDLSAAARATAAEAGVPLAESGAEAARGADVVVTMLPKGAHVLAAYRELLPAASPDALFIDSSTIDIADARAAHAAATGAGRRFADAPVSGGVPGATAGTLTFMVGADEAVFKSAEPVLAAMGRRVVHCGGPGAGQAAKICNNMILGVSMIAVSEAFALGERLGLEYQALFDVAANASGQCWALTANCPAPGPVPASPANRDYAPGFATALMAKDLGLAASAARASGLDARLGLAAADIYDDFNADGGAGLDFSAIFTRIRERHV